MILTKSAIPGWKAQQMDTPSPHTSAVAAKTRQMQFLAPDMSLNIKNQ